MIVLSARQFSEPKTAPTAFGTGGFYSPDGKFYTKDEGEYHMNWVLENYDWLTKIKKVQLPSIKELYRLAKTQGADSVRNLLVGQGWIHVYSLVNLSLADLNRQESQLMDFFADNRNNYELDDEVEVFDMSRDRYITMQPGKMFD